MCIRKKENCDAQTTAIWVFPSRFRDVSIHHAAFPDCEAKRNTGNNRYQRVRIKFEYKSSNFKSQGYDSAGADMIVCWIHDWPDCPIEVLELKNAIDKLKR